MRWVGLRRRGGPRAGWVSVVSRARGGPPERGWPLLARWAVGEAESTGGLRGRGCFRREIRRARRAFGARVASAWRGGPKREVASGVKIGHARGVFGARVG